DSARPERGRLRRYTARGDLRSAAHVGSPADRYDELRRFRGRAEPNRRRDRKRRPDLSDLAYGPRDDRAPKRSAWVLGYLATAVGLAVPGVEPALPGSTGLLASPALPEDEQPATARTANRARKGSIRLRIASSLTGPPARTA